MRLIVGDFLEISVFLVVIVGDCFVFLLNILGAF